MKRQVQRQLVDDDGCGIFVYAGTVPNTQLYTQLDLAGGYISVNAKMETKIPGVYAAGDIRVKQVRQVATAVSDGAVAAINAAVYIKGLAAL
jgi:thioredoxin reductase (NADPH)